VRVFAISEFLINLDLPETNAGAFPHSVLSQLRPLLSSSTRSTRPASQQAAVEALEQCLSTELPKKKVENYSYIAGGTGNYC